MNALHDSRRVFIHSHRASTAFFCHLGPTQLFKTSLGSASLARSQLLFWTGFGEAPVRREMHRRVVDKLAAMSLIERTGFDVAIAQSVIGGATHDAIDCT